jgi:hypothetical protein
METLKDCVTAFFASGFFHESSSPKPLKITLGSFRIFFVKSWRYSQIKLHHHIKAPVPFMKFCEICRFKKIKKPFSFPPQIENIFRPLFSLLIFKAGILGHCFPEVNYDWFSLGCFRVRHS